MKLVSQITAAFVLVLTVSGVAYKAFSLEQRVAENSRAIVIFSIDKLEKLIEELREKQEKQGGRLSPEDQGRLERYQKQLDLEYKKLGQ